MSYIDKEKQAEAQRKHYEANKEKFALRGKESRHSRKQYIQQAKSKPCEECKIEFPYYMMEFDHVRGTKLFSIGAGAYNKGLAKIKEEIAKCEVVCANCHKMRTWQRYYNLRT